MSTATAYDLAVAVPLPPNYPSQWETHAVLSDGEPVEIRPIRPTDRDALDAFHRRQSSETIYFRFFRPRPGLSAKELDHFTELDYVGRMAFVALLGDELVAVARYESTAGHDRPEVAFLVGDDYQGRGLGTLLLEYLAAAARSHEIHGFTATVLTENYAMLGLFRRAGFRVATRFEDGLIAVDIDISITADASSAISARHRRARSHSVARLLRPSSVAVVGAGRRPGSVGHELLRGLIDGGFTGEIFPVNHSVDEVLGRQAWPSLTAIGQKVDLVIVAVPAAAMGSVMSDAVEADSAGLLIVSSGFGETGPEGAARERELVRIARNNGMRVIGPNAFGLINTSPDVELRALFVPVASPPGSVAVMSQSGSLGAAVLDHLRAADIGISSFVGPGNRADVSVNDLLEFWADDDDTSTVLLYVENYGNLRTFAHTARSVSAHKPVVAVAPPDDNLVELLSQSGVIVVDGVAELAEVARVASTQPVPGGRRVAIVANAASVARLAAAACRRYGLVPVIPSSVELTPGQRGASADTIVVGDVESIAAAGAEESLDLEQILVAAAVCADVDALLVGLLPTADLGPSDLASLLGRVDRSIDKPMVAAALVDVDRLSVPRLPVFAFPEEAARTLGRLADYADWRRTESGGTDSDSSTSADSSTSGAHTSDPEDPSDAGAALQPLLGEMIGQRSRVELSLWSPMADQVIEALDVPVAEWRVVATRDELKTAAASLGFPVVLKAGGIDRHVVGEAGGVSIDIHDGDQLEAAYERMSADLGSTISPAVVQVMVPTRGHVKVEVIQDPDLGAFARVGLGGSAGSALPAVSRRFLPIIAGEATTMVDALTGVAALSAEERTGITAMIERLAAVADAVPDLARITLDPVLLSGASTSASDFRITIRRWQSDPLSEVRRL